MEEKLDQLLIAMTAMQQDFSDLKTEVRNRFDALEQNTNQHFDALEQNTNQRLDEFEQNTNQRLDALEQNTNQRLDEFEQHTNQRLDALKEDFGVRIARVFKRLLLLETHVIAIANESRAETKAEIRNVLMQFNRVHSEFMTAQSQDLILKADLLALEGRVEKLEFRFAE